MDRTTAQGIGDYVDLGFLSSFDSTAEAEAVMTTPFTDRLSWTSAAVGIDVNAVLGSGETFELDISVLHSDAADGSDSQVYATGQLLIKEPASKGTAQVPVDLTGAKRYMAVRATPTFTADAADQAHVKVFAAFAKRSV